MTSVKIAVSLPARLVAHAKRTVRKGEADSVSAYIAGALEQRAQHEDLAALLREMLGESGGPLTKAEQRAADAALGLGAPRRRRPTRKSA